MGGTDAQSRRFGRRRAARIRSRLPDAVAAAGRADGASLYRKCARSAAFAVIRAVDRIHRQLREQTLIDFVIGRELGPIGRWLRLFLGVDVLVFPVLNPLYLHPFPAQKLPGFALSLNPSKD